MRRRSPRQVYPTSSIRLQPVSPVSVLRYRAALRPKGLLESLPALDRRARSVQRTPRRPLGYSVKYYGLADGDFAVLTTKKAEEVMWAAGQPTPVHRGAGEIGDCDRLLCLIDTEPVMLRTPLDRRESAASKCAAFWYSDEKVEAKKPTEQRKRRLKRWIPEGVQSPEEGGSVFKPILP